MADNEQLVLPGQTIDDSALFSLPVLFPLQAQRSKGRVMQTFFVAHIYLEYSRGYSEQSVARYEFCKPVWPWLAVTDILLLYSD